MEIDLQDRWSQMLLRQGENNAMAESAIIFRSVVCLCAYVYQGEGKRGKEQDAKNGFDNEHCCGFNVLPARGCRESRFRPRPTSEIVTFLSKWSEWV
ncbi:hypothetical protein CEXT_561241 [Caerostris extrusa]|uniref:Uncharacterized protein n=1 Tax=Caerostris extrusa TaxID=172846 RepID=A0AAV4M3K5_CAEEX|nr:hypothetical protein CEXT_561241 [Caerostris extrusa]